MVVTAEVVALVLGMMAPLAQRRMLIFRLAKPTQPKSSCEPLEAVTAVLVPLLREEAVAVVELEKLAPMLVPVLLVTAEAQLFKGQLKVTH